MMTNAKRILITLSLLIFYCSTILSAQTLTERLQKLAWKDAPSITLLDWEILLPSDNNDEISYEIENELEKFTLNSLGQIETLTLFENANAEIRAKWKTEIQYLANGKISHLELFTYSPSDSNFHPSARFERLFDDMNQELQFQASFWNAGEWETSYFWKRENIERETLAISAAMHP